jgi:hypothetical protein
MTDSKDSSTLGKRKRTPGEADIDEPSAKSARVEGLDSAGAGQGITHEWEPKGHIDFTILLGDSRFLVHKAVIAQKSSVLKSMVYETAGAASVDLTGVHTCSPFLALSHARLSRREAHRERRAPAAERAVLLEPARYCTLTALLHALLAPLLPCATRVSSASH